MIAVKQIKNGNTKKAQQTLLIKSKCVVLARVINIIFFHAEAGIILKLFLNLKQKYKSRVPLQFFLLKSILLCVIDMPSV